MDGLLLLLTVLPIVAVLTPSDAPKDDADAPKDDADAPRSPSGASECGRQRREGGIHGFAVQLRGGSNPPR